MHVTIGDLIASGKSVWVYCRNCGRERDLDPAALPVPPAQSVPLLGRRMRCSACGSRKITTRPELYPGGIEGQRERAPGL